MSLASEDRSLIQKIGGQIHSAQIRTNELLIEVKGVLEEIRDAVKNPPVQISGSINEKLLTAQRSCTCGESKAPCPVHEG